MEKHELITGLNMTWDLLHNLEACQGIGKGTVKEINDAKDFIQKLQMQAKGTPVKS